MKIIAYILSCFYALVVKIRNLLYNKGCIKHWIPPVKTICVGNLAVGGTGKTPHAIFILQALRGEFSLAFLSRGYRRKTKGYIELTLENKAKQVGDEPSLVKRRFPHIPVAVCEKRKIGIITLIKQHPEIDCILLDDAMQHRAVKPGKTLLLTTYDQLYIDDTYLPHGSLRDSIAEAKRADWIMITKCPPQLTQQEQTRIIESLGTSSRQEVFFSSIIYGLPRQIDGDCQLKWSDIQSICLITGIANPHHIEAHVSAHVTNVKTMHFADHHDFTQKDFISMQQQMATMPQGTILLTTEKDLMRMIDNPHLPSDLRSQIHYLPIETQLIKEQDKFIKILKDYVREN